MTAHPGELSVPRGAGDAVVALVDQAVVALSPEYRDLEVIGFGTNGIVLGAVPRGGGAPVALKVDFGMADPRAHERFEAECRAGQQLTHHAIVPVSAAKQAGSVRYFVMPYVGKGRLDLLLRMGHPPRTRALAILRSLASALDHAHARGIVHGALRPSKVHLLRKGGCMLSGFMLQALPPEQRTSLPPADVGDPAYMPPEQRAGVRIDGRVDQYALAVIASELLFGARPVVHGKSGVAELRPVHSRQAGPTGDGDQEAESAIHRAMLPDPLLRFRTTGEFVEALAGHPVKKHSETEPPLPPPRWRRTLARRTVVLLAALAALLLASTVVRPAWRRVRGSDLVPPSLTVPERR
jgi:serine/threonine protein kinase